jgi:D-sedoheptulose 7-phosphate isomerase
MTPKEFLKNGAVLLEKTANAPMLENMERAIAVTVEAFKNNHALLTCGNGGSAADSMHIAGEFVGRFMKERKAYSCISLSSNPVILTALANDYPPEMIFARQVEAHGQKGGVLLGLSTSGNSKNVVEAFKKAKETGMTTIGLTGEGGGKMAEVSDILLDVPSKVTPEIQQVHISLYHYYCAEVERRLSA